MRLFHRREKSSQPICQAISQPQSFDLLSLGKIPFLHRPDAVGPSFNGFSVIDAPKMNYSSCLFDRRMFFGAFRLSRSCMHQIQTRIRERPLSALKSNAVTSSSFRYISSPSAITSTGRPLGESFAVHPAKIRDRRRNRYGRYRFPGRTFAGVYNHRGKIQIVPFSTPMIDPGAAAVKTTSQVYHNALGMICPRNSRATVSIFWALMHSVTTVLTGISSFGEIIIDVIEYLHRFRIDKEGVELAARYGPGVERNQQRFLCFFQQNFYFVLGHIQPFIIGLKGRLP